MTWWWGIVRAAWARWDARRARRRADARWRQEVRERNRAYDDDTWLDSLSTPEDHTAGPFDPVGVPGQRYQGRGRHRLVIPNQPVRKDKP